MDKEKIKSDVSRFKEEFARFFSSHTMEGIYLTTDTIEAYSEEFIEIYSKRPVKENTGGTGIKPCYWLFVIAKFLSAELIIESGVWKGHSVWLLRQVNPRAAVHAFDVDLRNLEHRDGTISYHEMDWSRSNLFCYNPNHGIIFFDDHINQAKRVQEAHCRGFKWIFFDDNVPPEQFHRVGIPPLPTIDMMYNPQLKDGAVITWELQGTKHDFVFSLAEVSCAKKLIAQYYVFPTYTGLTLVQLKQPCMQPGLEYLLPAQR
jgi:hypothetical protein